MKGIGDMGYKIEDGDGRWRGRDEGIGHRGK